MDLETDVFGCGGDDFALLLCDDITKSPWSGREGFNVSVGPSSQSWLLIWESPVLFLSYVVWSLRAPRKLAIARAEVLAQI